MTQRLPRNLSPKAKYRLVRSDAEEPVRTMVTVAATADSADLTRDVAELGGIARSWSRETRLLTVDMPAGQLGSLARLAGVVHVDAAETYRP